MRILPRPYHKPIEPKRVALLCFSSDSIGKYCHLEFCSWKQGFRDSDWNLGWGGTRQESSEARRAGRSGRSKKAIHKRYSAILSVAEWRKRVGIRTCNLRLLVADVVVVVEISEEQSHAHLFLLMLLWDPERTVRSDCQDFGVERGEERTAWHTTKQRALSKYIYQTGTFLYSVQMWQGEYRDTHLKYVHVQGDKVHLINAPRTDKLLRTPFTCPKLCFRMYERCVYFLNN